MGQDGKPPSGADFAAGATLLLGDGLVRHRAAPWSIATIVLD